MPLTTHSTPYGLRDIKLTAYTDALGTVLAATSVDLPVAQTLSFSDTEDFKELRGDDQTYTTRGQGAKVEWELESGGIPLDAYKIMAGGTITETGTTPSQKKVYSKKGTDSRPWFRIEGQVISDSGGDLHCIIYRAKATGELSGEFADGEFYVQSASGEGFPVPSGTNIDKLYDFVQNETVTAFVQPT
jgi:hypothetical protein